ncbi:MAG: PEP-CTERM sorting domain-containing protein [Candidatus Eisenbacteria bacterium]
MKRPGMALLALAAAGCLLIPSIAGASYTTVVPNPTEYDLEGNGATDILNYLYGWGNLLRIHDAGAQTDMIWHDPNGHAEAVAKWASDSHEFGFYTGEDGGSFQSLFSTSLYGYLVNGDAVFNHNVTGYLFRFGLHNLTTDQYWSSKDADNGPSGDHMVTYRIIDNVGHPDNVLGNYIVAWEDMAPGDQDFNDLVVEVNGVNPIPEPATLTLLGLGFGAMGLATRIRRKRS